ncbi:MAG: carbohydrate-binding protein [Gemmatimonadales bacterium]
MQKRIVGGARENRPADGPWLDLERLVRVELTSEDAVHPVESALLTSGGPGWRAAEPGEQTIRLLFHDPQRLRRIWLRFVEAGAERTQEFVLRWSPDGRSFRDVVRQQYTFSPTGATSEVEDLAVELAPVTALELTIVPDQGRGRACASLAEWRIA